MTFLKVKVGEGLLPKAAWAELSSFSPEFVTFNEKSEKAYYEDFEDDYLI